MKWRYEGMDSSHGVSEEAGREKYSYDTVTAAPTFPLYLLPHGDRKKKTCIKSDRRQGERTEKKVYDIE